MQQFPTTYKRNLIFKHLFECILLAVSALTSCAEWSRASFVDSSSLKPSIVLIVPQSFRVPTYTAQVGASGAQGKLKQFVAVINNARSDRDDELLRQQYSKLTLQVRDAESPITGQLFYEHVFDYFPPNSPHQQHLLIPVDLDQVSPRQEYSVPKQARSYASALLGEEPVIVRNQQLIVSIRPYRLESGFGSDGIEFVSSAPIPVEAVPSSDGRRRFAVVQTDKPVYKPIDKVKIRSLVINEDLRPVTRDDLRLQIKNPHNIIVEEVRFGEQDNSTDNQDGSLYLDHEFEFPPEPMLGAWSASILHNDPIANDTTIFEVKEHVLPTYDIEFDSPKYILPTTTNITGSIIAKYIYGKPVQGTAQFKFGYQESLTSKPKFIARSSIKAVDPKTGRINYKINSEKFKETDWFPGIAGYRFVIEATVTETATGHREVSQDNSCSFITFPYRISFDDSVDDFKLGLRQQLTVQVLEMQTQRPAPPGALILAQYRDQNGTIMNSSTSDILETESFTDSFGRATFNIGPIASNVSYIQMILRWPNATLPGANNQALLQSSLKAESVLNNLAISQHTLVRHESTNGWISLMNKSSTHLNVGDVYVSDVLIRDASVVPRKIYYTIVSHNQIIGLDNLSPEGFVKFTITEAMMPTSRVVVFAFTSDDVGLLSDSMRINVHQDMSCGLNLRYKSDKKIEPPLKPNDKGKLEIQARQGDLVSIIGVDSALYALNNRSRLESSHIIERIRRLDSGCGFGGGKNNMDVFLNAGLMLFKNIAGQNPSDSKLNHIGSLCLTITNQLRHIEDMQLGYVRPSFSAVTTANRQRSLESSLARHRNIHSRNKRDTHIETILKRYKDPLHKSCCHLGTLEDLPQRRNCSVRARIVGKYMRQYEFRSCSTIYFDCCRSLFGEPYLLSSMISARDHTEPVVEPRIIPSQQAPQYSEAVLLESIETQTLIRKDFRETWLFELVRVNETNGLVQVDVQLPHSITTWSISAISLNRYHPMCIMPKTLDITTFKEIFLHVSMPYKVVQGEQIDLIATVFNYSPREQEIIIYMYGVEDICSEAEPNERSERKRIRVASYASTSVLYPMIPLKVGSYPIKIVAITTLGDSDIIERNLNVVPRGKPVTDETTFSLDPINQQRRNKRAIQTGNLEDDIDSSRGLQRSKVRLTPTRDSDHIVPQTQECIVSAIGDKMGQSVQSTMVDVENLIRLPHGCGEQVMIYLGPTLYSTRYLSSINKLSGDLRWRAVRYIQSGYKRVLNYRREGGGFSAFPRREPSIWLTAFVTKLLCQTERTPSVADQIHVDKTVINMALRWLIEAQNRDSGTWTELNPVYHREMLGGVLKENLLTAFVTLSLNECAHHSPDLVEEISDTKVIDHIGIQQPGTSEARTNGIDRLRESVLKAEQAMSLNQYKAVREKNPYVLALTAYAMSFSRPRDAAIMLDDLMILADRSQSRNQLFWKGDYPIETAAYALQAIIELAPVLSSNMPSTSHNSTGIRPGADAIAISNWLTSRRSYTGAFESTQDTVVALEALSKFAQLQSSPNGYNLVPQVSATASSLVCNMTISNRTRRSIEFGKDNAHILQTFKIESSDISSINEIDILTSGNGLGTMSVKLKYNVFQDDDELCRFNIDSSIEEWQPKLVLTNHDTVKDKNSHNETSSADDYFSVFSKSMLNELNLINEFNSIDNASMSDTQKRSSMNLRGGQRLRRSSPQILNLSARNATNWTSKVVSNLKAKLPAWLSPSDKNQGIFTTTPYTYDNTDINSYISDDPHRKSNASRRSALSTPASFIQRPTGIPNEARLNTLSKHIIFDQNETESNSNTSSPHTKQVSIPSHRLVLLLRICVHHTSIRRDSEMAVIEVGILSGFKPNEADLKEILNDIGTPAMKYEISSDRSLVIIYMQYIPFSGPYCIQFRLIRNSLVYNIQPGYIRAYEYYSPTHSCSNFYTPTRIADLIETKCDSTGSVCQCAAKSMCPATNKLWELAEIHASNTTSARNKLVNLICSNRFSLVSVVRLKSVRYIEEGKMYKIHVKTKLDLKGNLTKIIDAQRQQKMQLAMNVRKPLRAPTDIPPEANGDMDDNDASSLDYLKLNIDSSCIRSDTFLLHLAHASQWKSGGEMILFGSLKALEKQFFTTTSNMLRRNRQTMTTTQSPKSSIFIGSNKIQENQGNSLEDVSQYQYSMAMSLDKDTILYDLAYHGRVEQREAINGLISWAERRFYRERYECPKGR